jgi:hypothetical protein
MVAERDKWICHRCERAIDPALPSGHPLALVADHYPVPDGSGGPTVMENLRAAHSLCNGSHLPIRPGLPPDYRWLPDAERRIVEELSKLPRDDWAGVCPLRDGAAGPATA